MAGIPIPYLFGKEEGIIGYFSFERVRRDTEESISIGEVVMITRVFVLQ